jgi:protocatechuate 3,4-dioxygenase beta subunit
MVAMRAGAALVSLLLLAAGVARSEETAVAVTGRVVDRGGSPLGNVHVELQPVLSRYESGLRETEGEDPAAPVASSVTDAGGRFALHAPTPGMWRVVVAADGFVPRQNLLLPLLEDVELPAVELRVLSEVQSRFPIASPGGWEPVERKETVGEDGAIRSQLRFVSLTGRVIDRDTRRPLPGAWVWPAGDPGRWVRTDVDGAFRLQGIAVPAETGLAAATAGYLPGSISFQGSPPGNPVLALAPSATLSGTVFDARGRPLADAAVNVSRIGGWADEEARAARTSAEGAFRIPSLQAGANYSVTAALAGFSPASTAVAIPKTATLPLPALRLVLGRGRRAFGRVVDGGGRPVAGARVELASGNTGRVVASGPDPETPLFHVRTGPDGTFALRHLPAGWFHLRIEARGFPAFERTGVEIAAGAAAVDLGRFLLQRGAALQGKAVDPEGQPLRGAEVWIIPSPVRDWTDLYAKGPAAVTAADGSFVVRDLPLEGSFGLDVCRAGYLPLSAIVREITQEPFEAVLRRAARISGRVTGTDGGPVPAARIESWLTGEEPARSESLRPCRRGAGAATADSEGRFQLDGLQPGWWNVRAAAEGHVSATRERLHVPAGDNLDVEIVLDPGATVSGRIFTADGEPAAGARVSSFVEAGTAETLAGGDGTYRLAGVETGERTIEATLGEGVWASRTLTVMPGDNRLDLTMDQGARRQEIRGRVFGPDGTPVGGAGVFAGSTARTFTSADGTFTLAVEDNQTYEVWAEKKRFAAARAGTPVRVAGAPVTGVEIRLGRGGSLSGRLLGLDREELTRASVEVELIPPFLARAAVDSQGSYRIEDVPPGEWTVTARAGDRTVREQAVLPPEAADATVVDLAFAPSHEVSGWVSGPDGEPVAGAFIRFFAPGGSNASTYSRSDGGFRLRLEDGTYRVVARREGYLWTAQEEPVAVEGGPVAGVELLLDAGAVIRGRIVGLEPGERAKAVWASAKGGNGRREGQLDQEGGFVIADVPPGDWTVTVAHGGREASAPVQLDAGREEWVEVDLEAP